MLSQMLKQQSSQNILVQNQILCRLDCKTIIKTHTFQNRIACLTPSCLYVICHHPFIKIKGMIKVEHQKVVDFKINSDKYISILYACGTIEVRDTQKINELIFKTKVNVNGTKIAEKIYFQDEHIFVMQKKGISYYKFLTDKKLSEQQIDFVKVEPHEQIYDICHSKLIDNEETMVINFGTKLTFNIGNTFITQIQHFQGKITNVILLVSSRYKNVYLQNLLPREYMVTIINNKKLKIYNMINLKQITQMQMPDVGQTKLQLNTDLGNQFLLINFLKNGEIVKNLLYKINTGYYYKGNNYFEQDENFFTYEIDLQLKQNLHLLNSKFMEVFENKFISLDMWYSKINDKLQTQIFLVTVTLNPIFLNKNFAKMKKKDVLWKQAREWKQIVTSYIEMKSQICKFHQYQLKQNQNKHKKNTNAITNQQAKNLQKLQILKKTVVEAGQSFKKQRFPSGLEPDEDLQKILSTQLSLYMIQYFKSKNIEIPQLLQQIQQRINFDKKKQLFQKQFFPEQIQQVIEDLNHQDKKLNKIAISENTQDPEEEQESESEYEDNQLKNQLSEQLTNYLQPLCKQAQIIEQGANEREQLLMQKLEKLQKGLFSRQSKMNSLNNKVQNYFKQIKSQINTKIDYSFSVHKDKTVSFFNKSNSNEEQTVSELGMYIQRQLELRQSIFDMNRQQTEMKMTKIRKQYLIPDEYYQEYF